MGKRTLCSNKGSGSVCNAIGVSEDIALSILDLLTDMYNSFTGRAA